MIKLLTLILMLTTGTATAAPQQQTIPAQFRGKWDLDLESYRTVYLPDNARSPGLKIG
ncbi:hypothetical protein L8106_13680 [Lyngbya sp. PCC 8106]|nr:hypothetical protein L8106_13680 [Lyngbya sp. PCC 8106]